jgi:antitoxin (DNA-binding transcriptional repressor) of toxin-antitoxin stability system
MERKLMCTAHSFRQGELATHYNAINGTLIKSGGYQAVTICCRLDLCYNSTMTTVNISDIEQNLAGYLRRVQLGETLLVVDADQPLAEIKPVPNDAPPKRKPRPFGARRGDFVVPDNFDDPLPEEILQDFERASL